MIQPKLWMSNLAGLILTISISGCLPASQREQTDVQPATDIVISIDKGKTVVGPPAKSAPEGEENASDPPADSEK